MGAYWGSFSKSQKISKAGAQHGPSGMLPRDLNFKPVPCETNTGVSWTASERGLPVSVRFHVAGSWPPWLCREPHKPHLVGSCHPLGSSVSRGLLPGQGARGGSAVPAPMQLFWEPSSDSTLCSPEPGAGTPPSDPLGLAEKGTKGTVTRGAVGAEWPRLWAIVLKL